DRDLQSGQVGGADAGAGLHLAEGGAGADPELTGPGVGVELLGVAAGQGAEVQGGLVVRAVVSGTGVHGLQHEHGVRFVVHAQAGQVGERRVGAEPVVGVVGPDLER